MFNNLSEKFERIKGFYYDEYKDLPNICDVLKSEFEAQKFIFDYSKSGMKEKLALCFKDDNIKNKGIITTRHRHSVALYYLGCHLKEILTPYLDSINNLIADEYKEESFLYTWFLTCLYHDLAVPLESQKVKDSKSINKLIDKVFNHKFSGSKNKRSLYYCKTLIINYLKYRKSNGKIDHGIYAGSFLFDSFCKNYRDAEEKFGKIKRDKNTNAQFTVTKPELSYILVFNPGLIDHFNVVAQTIMCHNIWNVVEGINILEDIKLYKENKLDSLIISGNEKGKKINLYKWPLLFFLDLLDSIEPFKSFPDHDIKSIFKNIAINYDETNKVLTIEANKDEFCSKDFFIWTNKIRDLQNWMDLIVNEEQAGNAIKLELQFNPYEDKEE